MRFEIEIEEVLRKVVAVEARSFDEAMEKVREMYKNEELVLTADDWQETNYKEVL